MDGTHDRQRRRRRGGRRGTKRVFSASTMTTTMTTIATLSRMMGMVSAEDTEDGDKDPSTSTVALGLGLTTAAGLATVIGAFIVFSEKYVKLADGRVLAAALGLSAGVMIYVSFVEMFGEALANFEESGQSEGASEAWTGLGFFGGMGICKGLDMIVHYLEDKDRVSVETEKTTTTTNNADDETTVELHRVEIGGEETADDRDEEKRNDVDDVGTRKTSQDEVCSKSGDNNPKLRHMGLLTAAAVALHNFPEGLATFVGTLDDTSVGVTLAIAIAIHNVPEGIAVAMPIYYGTGNKRKALLWAFLSGIAEPLGALIGYVALMDHFSAATYGVVFSLVAGMMVYISFVCLLPTAHKYDPDNEVTSLFLVSGMFVMGLSIVLFSV